MKIGVVGFGLMGSQITQFFAQSRFEVIALDVNEEKLKKGMNAVIWGRFGLKRLVEKGKINEDEMEEIVNRISTSTNYEDLKDADLVIEAVFEDIGLKKEVLEKISEVTDAIIGSNTSSISITKLSSAVKSPEKFLGIHFFNPAQIQKLVELVRGLLTSEDVIAEVRELFSSLGKVPIVVKDSPGFATTRLGLMLGKEAMLMVQEGVATPQDIDIGMMLGYGYTMGPIETGDLVGLDTRLRIYESMYEMTKDPKWAPPRLLVQLVDAGYLGDPSVRPESKGGVYEYFGQERATQVLKRLGLRK
ncbi:3-hydroxyacyl-CoA dehydrogenase [Archaeoglobus sulfaticallidus PM70-1]|uniref:3-hydroxyacyl-CoA dehydrogenase n=1 Tax=Archaeoglobus sulfaticallidus PM70-1 TaxID=387631 RepID=N0BKX9_9EURY|nr:3-hydroxyacyl-CoA dehydrogenase family protein [Archaeoglobus sulfaticallidus]AGK61186.1 3-hydroxyacyl-CoA dehydrogenase [Archaeoglobus sulfaticallidus PM70-1]